uniref:Tubulin epsilon and delta complex protein 2 n=1 Tax=Eptatretus burgeri TaxID=7764 RepID=A0A8C4NKM5_EPTBU
MNLDWKSRCKEDEVESACSQTAQAQGGLSTETKDLEVLTEALARALRVRTHEGFDPKNKVFVGSETKDGDSSKPHRDTSRGRLPGHDLTANKGKYTRKAPFKFGKKNLATGKSSTRAVGLSTSNASKPSGRTPEGRVSRDIGSTKANVRPSSVPLIGVDASVRNRVPASSSCVMEGAMQVFSEQECEDDAQGVTSVKKMTDDTNSFLLERDGKNLVLPERWRKLYMNNQRLREKAFRLESRCLPEEEIFVKKLKLVFARGGVSPTGPAEAETFVAEIRQMALEISAVVEDYEAECAESVGWQESYRSLKTMELLLDLISELQEEASLIAAALQQWQQDRQLLGVPDPLGLPDQSDCVHGLRPLVLSYKTLEELLTWEKLRHEVQELQQQLYLQKAIAKEVLPLVESMETDSVDFASVFRVAYSLLCENSRHFPSLMVDSSR